MRISICASILIDCGDAMGRRDGVRPTDGDDAGATGLPVAGAQLAADQLDRAVRAGRLAARHAQRLPHVGLHPDLKDRAMWSGACPAGKKEGRGVEQWSEHGYPIDRFEGHLSRRQARRLRPLQLDGRHQLRRLLFERRAERPRHRQGAGRELRRRLAEWLLRQGRRVVAIGVERSSCAGFAAERTSRERCLLAAVALRPALQIVGAEGEIDHVDIAPADVAQVVAVRLLLDVADAILRHQGAVALG